MRKVYFQLFQNVTFHSPSPPLCHISTHFSDAIQQQQHVHSVDITLLLLCYMRHSVLLSSLANQSTSRFQLFFSSSTRPITVTDLMDQSMSFTLHHSVAPRSTKDTRSSCCPPHAHTLHTMWDLISHDKNINREKMLFFFSLFFFRDFSSRRVVNRQSFSLSPLENDQWAIDNLEIVAKIYFFAIFSLLRR